MKKLYISALLVLSAMAARAQSPVSVGAGSYASFPPSPKDTGQIGYFINKQPIYVTSNKKNAPVPTNDWWTDLIVNGNNAGALWAYPLVLDPEPNGVKIHHPVKIISDGTGMNMEYGGSLLLSADNYHPQAYARDWSDWGLVMSMPDSVNGKNMTVTTAHGVPFTWIETQKMNPVFVFERSASCLNADNSAVVFPTNKSFVVKTDGRCFGIHLDGKSTASIENQQYVIIDLGTTTDISKIRINWENAYATGYSISLSDDKASWRNVFSEANSNGDVDEINLTAKGRFVKLSFAEKATAFGYSIWELQVFNGNNLLSQNKNVEVSSTQGAFVKENINDGNLGTRWGSDLDQRERLVLNTGGQDAFMVISALPSPLDLTYFEKYAFNKVTDTRFNYKYDVKGGKIGVTWQLTTANLMGGPAGVTLQGFLPHLYADATHNIAFTPYSYVTNHGSLKIAEGNNFSFTYDFGGILPTYTAPFRNKDDAHPYDAKIMFDQITKFAKRNDFGEETYWGGKDLVNFAKYTLMAKELDHQAYETLKEKTRQRLVDWLTYRPGEPSRYFAYYDRWKALVGFNDNFWSYNFTDNHFHYGYFTLACALYGMADPDFIKQYGPMIRMIAKQYANWDRKDQAFPYFRTFDPWIGHSYAGGISSGSGNNQESSSEGMQSWVGLFLLGDVMNDEGMRNAGAYGYTSESYSALEYWFDWKKRNLPADYAYKMVAIVSNQGSGHLTFFGDRPIFIHGIEYLPVVPGFKYLARDTAWAKSEYDDLMQESKQKEGITSESGFGKDWAHVALGFKQLFDPGYVAGFLEKNNKLPVTDANYVMDEKTAGITYFYTHANQNLGSFSFIYHTDFPSSSVFEKNGRFSHAVAYNPTESDKKCTVYDASGKTIASFTVPAGKLITYPTLPEDGNKPEGCYSVSTVKAYASSGNPDAAIDGDPGSRWESKFEDPQYLLVDLGKLTHVNQVAITWERANAKDYNLLASRDSLKWDTIAIKTNMDTASRRVDIVDQIGKDYRFLKMDGKSRNTPYGYSIYEFEVCGTAVVDTTEKFVTVPALIEAENYDQMSGVQTEPTNDAAGGLNVGYIDSGDWMDYKINVPSSGNYILKLRLSSTGDGGKVGLGIGDKTLATLNVPLTGGWQTWTTVTDTLRLEEGEQTLHLSALAPPFNINWIEIKKPFDGFSKHIEAEHYSGMSGIQTENTNDIEGGLDVAYLDAGDWLDYTINVPQPGFYTIKYRIASPYTSGILQFSTGNASAQTVNIPETEGFQNWITVTSIVNFPAAGLQTFRLNILGGGFNLNWMDLEAQSSGGMADLTSVSRKNSLSKTNDDVVPSKAVSANGDGINDYLAFDGIQKYPDNKLTVINVNGDKVFEVDHYDNQSHVFDGKQGMKSRQPAGTYYYILEYKKAGIPVRKSGYFLLKY